MAGQPIYYEEPKVAKWLFGSSGAAAIWLVARLWLGWYWLQFGWRKVFGGTITARFWDWGDGAHSIWGSGNIGWVRGGTVLGADGAATHVGAGDNVAFWANKSLEGGDVFFGWYRQFLEWVRDTAHPVIGPAFSVAELLLGVALIVGAFVGIAAFVGGMMNLSTLLGGTSALSPVMVAVSVLLIMAWRNAGYYGADRYLLRELGTPWHPGEFFLKRRGRRALKQAA